MSPDENGWTTLSVADRSAASASGYTWYHVIYALGFNPLSGQLPTIAARLASPLPIQGSGTFTARRTVNRNERRMQRCDDDRNVHRPVPRAVRRMGDAQRQVQPCG